MRVKARGRVSFGRPTWLLDEEPILSRARPKPHKLEPMIRPVGLRRNRVKRDVSAYRRSADSTRVP